MLLVKNERKADSVLSILPDRISREIYGLCRCRKGNSAALREIRLRAEGRASVIIGRDAIPLMGSVSCEETGEILRAVCDGAVYAHRESISSGYVSMACGVRVGVSGTARYESSSLVGIDDVRTLVFRIPGGECSFANELEEIFRRDVKDGMLIYSPPGVGKTTALRSLAGRLGGGISPLRVCIVDERWEFSSEDYKECEVDILKGYKRRQGIDIAVRTMSPDVVMIDEIGADDAAAIADATRCGIPIVATAHAKSSDELFAKPALKALFECGAFNVFVGISESPVGYSLEVNKK